MKIFNILFFPLFFYLSAFGQEKKDTTNYLKAGQKEYFIGVQAGGGIGWRKYSHYQSLNETINKVYPQTETPGSAYSFSIIGGFSKMRWNFSIGLEYMYVSYQNNNAPVTLYFFNYPNTTDTVIAKTKYVFIHQLFSIPFIINYSFGKKNNWYAGTNFRLGINYYLHQQIEYYNYSWKSDRNYSSINPVLFMGAKLGRRIITTKNLDINFECDVDYSSKIMGTYYSNYSSNGSMLTDQTRPRSLMITSFIINLRLKL